MTKKVLLCAPVLAAFISFLSATQQSTPANALQRRTTADLVKTSVDGVVQIVTIDALGKPLGLGSGFIASADGKIITNHHVVSGAHSATIKLNSGAFFPMEAILADDPENDLAVLKVAGRNLPALAFASHSSASLGEKVVAIGSPLGLENSVSDGIISGFRDDAKGRKWIQITAPVSPGNSGGPLLAEDGRVIGVVTLGSVNGAQNLNFAIPIEFVAVLLEKGPVAATRPAPSSVLSATSAHSTTTVWTSMISGRDYTLRFDGDYLYSEWSNIPDSLRQAGGFARTEFKRSGEKWVGKTRALLPCKYYTQVKWCSVETQTEITRITDTRIEGIATGYEKLNCRKCEPEKIFRKEFTWIPK